MEQVRALSSVANMLRAEANIPLRQPLAQFMVEAIGPLTKNPELVRILQEEINVHSVLFGVPTDVNGVKWTESAAGKVYLDTKLTPELQAEGRYRELLRKLQEARKQAGLNMGQLVRLSYHTTDEALGELLQSKAADLKAAASFSSVKRTDSHQGFVPIAGEALWVHLNAS